MNKVIHIILLVAILGTTCLLSWNGLTEGHQWGGDFASYIMQAQSILNGSSLEFIETNKFAMEKSTHRIGPDAYPWGFPLLLAPFYAFFGLNMLALKSLNIICYLLFIITLWMGFKRYHSPFWHVILVCLFAFNPYLLRYLDILYSDISFLLFSTTSILFIGRVVIQKRTFISKTIDQLLLGVLIGFSFLIRQQGILILATLIATQFIMMVKKVITPPNKENTAMKTQQKQIYLRRFSTSVSSSWRFLLIYIVFFIFILVWWATLPEGGAGHLSKIRYLSLGQIKDQLIYYFIVPRRFFLGFPEDLRGIFYGASVPIFILGMFKRRHLDYHITVYGLLTMLLLIIWPERLNLRGLFSLLPFYASFVFTGLETFYNKEDKVLNVSWRVVSACSVILIIVVFLTASIKYVSRNLANHRQESVGPYLPTSKALFSFISENTEEDSIIVFFKPRVMRLFTNRQSICIDQVNQITRGDYLCLYLKKDVNHQIGKDDVVNILKEDKIRLLYENMDFRLYKIIK